MSASPAPEGERSGGKEEITFRFCRECSNMLYPKEDRFNSTLMFACRTCQFSEPAPSSCVYRNDLSNSVGETAGVTQDVGSDPTVSDFSSAVDMPLCTLCGNVLWASSSDRGKGINGIGGEAPSNTSGPISKERGEKHKEWFHYGKDWGEDDMEDIES